MGVRPVEIFYSYSAGIYFSSQNLTSTDIRKSIPVKAVKPLNVTIFVFDLFYQPFKLQLL